MKRRELVKLLGGAVAWPLAARAQQAQPPTIGFLGGEASTWSEWTAAFVRRLRELGWIEGRTVAIEFRWSEGRPERIAEIANEFVRLKVDVIVTNDSAASTMKRATSVIPIAFVLGYDPVATGLVASLARPGGNVTGLSIQSPDLAGKRLEILREVVSGIRRLAIMANVGAPSMLLEMREVEAAARTFGIEAVPLEIRRAEDIAPVLKELRADALYVVTDAVTFTNRTRILTFTLTMRVPVVVNNRETVRAGALMSYGVNNPDLFRRAADLVDKILRGTRPGEIPVEQPTKFDLIINLTTAQALGVTIPESFLLRADEVIE